MPAIGALAGPQKAGGDVTKAMADANGIRGGQYQFYTGASLAIVAALIALMLPNLEQDVIANEDLNFRRYLESHGYDTSVLGIKDHDAGSGTHVVVEEQHPNKHRGEQASEKTLARETATTH
jgi:hypothetical protein